MCLGSAFVAIIKLVLYIGSDLWKSLELSKNCLDVFNARKTCNFVAILRCYKYFYVNSFLPDVAYLWSFLSIEYFLLHYNLNCFKSRIYRHLISLGFLVQNFNMRFDYAFLLFYGNSKTHSHFSALDLVNSNNKTISIEYLFTN